MKVLPKLKGLQNAPELLVGFIFLIFNLTISFWIVLTLSALGLGFDLSMVGWGLQGVLAFVTLMIILLFDDLVDFQSKDSSQS
jgi:hypothetical protein